MTVNEKFKTAKIFFFESRSTRYFLPMIQAVSFHFTAMQVDEISRLY